MVCTVRKKGRLLPSHRFINAFKSHKHIKVLISHSVLLCSSMIVCTQACLCAHLCIQANMHACVCEHTWILEDNLNSSSSEAVTLFLETVSLAQLGTQVRCAACRPASAGHLLLSVP